MRRAAPHAHGLHRSKTTRRAFQSTRLSPDAVDMARRSSTAFVAATAGMPAMV